MRMFFQPAIQSHLLVAERCPNEAPYAISKGHFCCAYPKKGQCEPKTTLDYRPCGNPPCKSGKTISRTLSHQSCPESFPYSFQNGSKWCEHPVDTLSRDRFQFQSNDNSCQTSMECQEDLCFEHDFTKRKHKCLFGAPFSSSTASNCEHIPKQDATSRTTSEWIKPTMGSQESIPSRLAVRWPVN